jgi:hypothetical protein
VLFDPLDFTTLGCYTFNSITIEDPESVPILNASTILSTPTDCSDLACQLLCNPCECVEFSGQAGTHNILTCDFKFGLVTGTPEGIVVLIEDEDPVPLTEGICLRFWEPIIFGPDTPVLTVTVKGGCDIVYWNQSGSEINCPTYYKIVNCENEFEQICVTNDLSALFATGAAITLAGQPNKCWRIEETEPCPQTYDINFTIIHTSCEDCLEKIGLNYQLINCLDPETVIYTSSDLSAYSGQIVSLNEYPEDCWFVQVLSVAIPSNIPVSVDTPFGSCDLCTQPQYLLEDCNLENPEDNIITNVDLSAYVGQVVTLSNCPDICWLVSETDPIPTPQLVSILEPYDTCESCAQPEPEPEPPIYKYKSIRPGYNTPACTPEQYEKIVCNFSEGVYKEMMTIRYGVTMCCGEDDLKWKIKNQLIYLKSITDPDYTCTVGSSCDCTTSTIGLTPCVPSVPQCNLYNIVVLSFDGTSFRYINCSGIESIVLVEPSKELVEYVICGRAGQTINTPDNTQEFNYVETTVSCTE